MIIDIVLETRTKILAMCKHVENDRKISLKDLIWYHQIESVHLQIETEDECLLLFVSGWPI